MTWFSIYFGDTFIYVSNDEERVRRIARSLRIFNTVHDTNYGIVVREEEED